MGYSFRYVLGAVLLVAVLFAGLSLVPTALTQWLAGRGHVQPTIAPAPAQPAAPPVGSQTRSNSSYNLPVPPPPPPVTRQSGPVVTPPRKTGAAPSGQPSVRSGPSPGSGQQGTPPASVNQQNQSTQPLGQSVNSGWGSVMPLSYQQPVDGQGSQAIGWCSIKSSIILRKTPGGEGYRAPSASLESLLIVGGSRVWAIRREQDWVMVRSPGRTIGWIEADVLLPMSLEVQQLYGGA